MPRYIDAEKLAEHKFPCVAYDRYVSDGKRKSDDEIYAYKAGYNEAISNIEQFAPTADVRENVHGEWIKVYDKWGDIVTTVEGYKCSICDYFNTDNDNYCPNCGARMESE